MAFMAPSILIRTSFADACRSVRISLDLTQEQVASRAGISRAYYSKVERGRETPSLALIERIADALGLRLSLAVQPPVIHGEPVSRDVVHARCSAYIGRRLRGAGWVVVREVLIEAGHHRGWIDLLAFDPRSGTVLVIECKTRLDDVGAVERQIAWYERVAWNVATDQGWQVRRVVSWLVVLASEEVEATVKSHRDLLAEAFPGRAHDMLGVAADGTTRCDRRGLAMVDPRSRRADWLIRTRVDGRRSPSPYVGYAHAARLLTNAAG
jgi:transcriptional regulator with XRE-family HTH domain